MSNLTSVARTWQGTLQTSQGPEDQAGAGKVVRELMNYSGQSYIFIASIKFSYFAWISSNFIANISPRTKREMKETYRGTFILGSY